MTRLIISLSFILVSIFDSFGQIDSTENIVDHYKTKRFDAAIFPKGHQDFISGNRFTPSREEIELAELALENELEKLNKRLENQSSTPIIHKNLSKYRRQYFGYIDENGHRILLINCFWSARKGISDGWLEGRIMVLDGGSYFWNIKYDLDEKKLFDLSVNGYA
jgi:hypothetical protein